MNMNDTILGPGPYGYPCKHGNRERTCESCMEEEFEEHRKDIEKALSKMKTRNYVANDDTYPTKITFTDGRVVEIKYENGRIYLDVGTK